MAKKDVVLSLTQEGRDGQLTTINLNVTALGKHASIALRYKGERLGYREMYRLTGWGTLYILAGPNLEESMTMYPVRFSSVRSMAKRLGLLKVPQQSGEYRRLIHRWRQ